ncbi:MAG: nucleoside triphosphate pyrophosphohydrolase [Deltaproteobacteria bacterium HGW-Deltaproteobacteria-10]|nr:MAG: nucleoside triphosphate pyrophosphohydrolase [Deltaproteobacteria bacterium HGW-Deltaproteobacteria-10]
MNKDNKIYSELTALMQLIEKLRAPDGCPWDRKQKPQDLGKYILEEAYEVIDSLETNDQQAIAEELGDLLFQILFLAQMGEEAGAYSLDRIMAGIREKMIRRHPHIFGDIKVTTVEEVKENWQQIKDKERRTKSTDTGLFSGIPRSLPALKRAQKITATAAVYGFDWPATTDVLKKLEEELTEFKTALNNNDHNNIEEELGDLLFTIVNLSRFVKVDSETALSRTTNKFLQRFAYITRQLANRGKTPQQASLMEMDELWEETKGI